MYKYIFKESNPLGPILYIVLTKVALVVGLNIGIGKYCPGPYLPNYHKYTASGVAAFGWLTFWIAFISEPGHIINEE